MNAINRRWLEAVPAYRVNPRTLGWLDAALAAYALAHIAFVIVMFANHWRFPLFLETMEGTVFQHFQRAAEFAPVYPDPTPDYVPLAYNPLFYYFAVPFSWVFGATLSTLRLTAFAGYAAAIVLSYLIVERRTQSRWWGLIAAGLLCAAYRSMDAYLDTAHSDSWLLASVLLGAYLIDGGTSRVRSLIGLLALIAAFWFKQHGAIFAIAGVLYLTWRDGLRRSAPYWLLAILLGPVLYIGLGPRLFGSQFHYFTWEVPHGWGRLNALAVLRCGFHLLRHYCFLFLGAVIAWAVAAQRWQERFHVWHFMLPAAGLSGLMGSLDHGSSDNVYIPLGAVVIICGVLAFAEFTRQADRLGRPGLYVPLIALSFALMLYDPRTVLLPSRSGEAYKDLVAMLNRLDGPVYSPSLGQLPDSYKFYPGSLWVALDDMTREANSSPESLAKTGALVTPALPKSGKAYLLLNGPIGHEGVIYGQLDGHFTLDQDFGDRFASLAGLPGRFLASVTSYPRYLYSYTR